LYRPVRSCRTVVVLACPARHFGKPLVLRGLQFGDPAVLGGLAIVDRRHPQVVRRVVLLVDRLASIGVADRNAEPSHQLRRIAVFRLSGEVQETPREEVFNFGGETVNLSLSNVVGGVLGPNRTAVLTISDNETDANPIDELIQLWQAYKPQMQDYLTRALDPRSAPGYGVPGDE